MNVVKPLYKSLLKRAQKFDQLPHYKACLIRRQEGATYYAPAFPWQLKQEISDKFKEQAKLAKTKSVSILDSFHIKPT
jgi:hypothetical protein